MKILKDTKNNGLLEIREINYEKAKRMIIENHYSKKWNTSFGKINIGIFKDNRLLGCAVFGNLMNPNSHSSLTNYGADSIIELNRLWIDDELKKNAETILLSSSFKIIKKEYPHIKYVQSFADGRLGCGTIYKASNFKYYGYSESLFFRDLDSNEVFHKVPLENTKRPEGFMLKNKRYLDNRLQPFKVKTYRYIYPLVKKSDIKLEEKKYPDYDIGFTNITYSHSLGLLCRLFIMYEVVNDLGYRDKVHNHILELGYTEHDIKKEIKIQNKNKSILWFKEDYISNTDNLIKVGQSAIDFINDFI